MLKSDSYEEVVEAVARGRSLWQMAAFAGRAKFGLEPGHFGLVERDVDVFEPRFLGAGELALDEFGKIGKAGPLVQPEQVRFHLSCPHQMDSRQQDSVDV